MTLQSQRVIYLIGNSGARSLHRTDKTDVSPNPTLMDGNSDFYKAAMTQYYANRTGKQQVYHE